MARFRLFILLIFVLSACIPTVTPTPAHITATPPQSPPITPTPLPSPLVTPPPSPLMMPQAVSTSLLNGNFEGPFTVRGNAVTVAQYWNYWQLNAPPCKPGSVGCDIPCPSNCNGCPSRDQGCYWAQPEYAAAYKPDYNPPRAHGGLWAQKTFVYGREGRYGLYQQINITSSAVLTFSIWFEAWQCMDGDHCSLQAVKNGGSPSDPLADPERALFLMGQWGCADYVTCKLWAASDRPYAMHMKVGIDPTGGISPTASSVVWGKEIESFDYWSQAMVTATRKAPGIVTVFAYASPSFDYARISNDVYMDDAELKIQLIAGPTYRLYLPIMKR